MTELSIILPVLNESGFIANVVKDIINVMDSSGIKYELVLAENGSTDNSLEVLRRLEKQHPTIKVCVAPHRGWGIAVLTGFNVASGEYICHMPSDGQVNHDILHRLWLEREEKTIVQVKRVVRESRMRYLNSKAYNFIGNVIFGVRLVDINGCPKMYHRKCIDEFRLASRDSFIDLEMVAKARKLGYKIKEIPIVGLVRIGGRSNINWKTVIEFLRNMYIFKQNLWRFGQGSK